MSGLILSIFPGIDLLGRAFEEEGWCVVRGPDLIWGGDIRTFHPPPSVFEGVIGGDPCQSHSLLAHLVRANGHEPRFPDMTGEFERIVTEAQPRWFLRENVPQAPALEPEGYGVEAFVLNNRWVGGVQHRKRGFWFGSRDGGRLLPHLEVVALEEPEWFHAVVAAARAVPVAIGGSGKPKQITVTARHGGRLPWETREGDSGRGATMPIEDACKLQGLPPDFTAHMPFTMQGKRSVIGNGVPIPTGRAVAKAVKGAMHGAPL